MTSQAFEAALDDSDDHASHLRLRKLISRANSSNFDSPAVAEKYLRAFCDTTSTAFRRRWVGIALAWMIKVSFSAVKHLQQLRQDLQSLGATILSQTEREETKIIAGLIIRQGLEQGLEYGSFWLSEKVKNSASNFPEDCSSRWMSAFQDFLDTLDELALTNPIADPSIIYPISLVASDDFRWQPSGDGLAIALIQAGIMTMIAPDDLLHNIRFVDIPIAHVCNLRSQRSLLYDSQARTTEHEPWDLTIALKGEAWTYSLDASRRTGDEITILFQHSEDAKEWESCVKEHIKSNSRDSTLKIHPMMSKSSPINLGPSRPSQSNALRAKEGKNYAYSPRPSAQVHSSSGSNMSSDAIDRDISRSPQRIAEVGTGREQKVSELAQPNVNTRSHQAVSTSKISRSAHLRNVCEKDSHNTQQDKHKTSLTQERKLTRSTQVRPVKSARSVEDAETVREQRTRQTTQGVDSFNSEGTFDEEASSDQIARTHLVSKQATHSKGKLQKVSQATKLRASQQLRAQSDMLDLPNEREEGSDASLEACTRTASSSMTTPHKQPQKPKITNHKPAARPKGLKSQTKGKAVDDDDDFVPNEEKPKKQTNRKRKSKSDATVGDSVRPKKKARVEAAEETRVDQEPKNFSRASVAVQKPSQIRLSKSRHTGATPTEKPPSSTRSSRHPVINGLLGSQQPPKASTTQFKRPKLPSKMSEPSSTPTQPKNRFNETRLRPQTPTDMKKSPKNAISAHDYSSPTPRGVPMSIERYRKPQLSMGAEVLSSNSKPVPASPNAESTAISGHADDDDVNLEKERGELQIAQSNPFGSQRKVRKATSFVRRLTGEEIREDESVHESQCHSSPPDDGIYDRPYIDQVSLMAKSQPLPPHVSWLRKEPVRTSVAKQMRDNIIQVAASIEPEAGLKVKMYKNTGDSDSTHPQHLQQTTGGQASLPQQRNNSQNLNFDTGDKPPHNAYNHAATQVTPDRLAPPTKPEIGTEVENIEIENSILTGSQHVVDDTQADDAMEELDGVNLDDEITLINNDRDCNTNLEPGASVVQFPSSPPVFGSPSSRSSTSAEHTPTSQPSLPTSEAEEMEWESSLQPHQRPLHDLLMRTSKRVLRHIVDNEIAVTDVAEVFAKDGEHVLNTLLQQHENDYDRVFHDMEDKAKGLKKGLETALKHLSKERSRINTMG